MVASSNPFQRGSRGWGVFIHQNHGTVGGNGSIMVGMFVWLCLASQIPFEREFFVPARMDVGVKLVSIATTAVTLPVFEFLIAISLALVISTASLEALIGQVSVDSK